MKKLLVLFSLITALNSFALEVGDDAPCVVLNHVAQDNSESEHCIRDAAEVDHFKFLEFFAVDCSACHRNLPKFSKLSEELSDVATFRLVGIDRDEQLLKNYIDSKKSLIKFETALDLNRDAKRAYDIFATPTLYILDSNDVVVFKHVGVLRDSDIKAIKELVRK